MPSSSNRSDADQERISSMPHGQTFTGDVLALEKDLQHSLRGEVRFDSGSRALYSTDASNYRLVPIGVVVPRDQNDIVTAVAVCREHGAPIVHRGGGTSLAGQTTNVAVVIDSSKYVNSILEIDPERKIARVEPGLQLDDLREEAAKYNLTFGPDPSTHEYCTLGGMIGNNACGVHSQYAGRTEDNIKALEILTYDGTHMHVGETNATKLEELKSRNDRQGKIYRKLDALRHRYADLIRERYPDIPRRVSGYSLPALLPENGFNVAKSLVGSEGSCVTYLEATVRLVYRPPKRTLVLLGYKDVFEAGDHVAEIAEFDPVGLEGIDSFLIDSMRRVGLHPESVQELPSGGLLFVEFGGQTQKEADAKAQQLVNRMKQKPASPEAKIISDPLEQTKMWEVRESGLGATAHVPGEPDTWPGWEDSAVPPEKIGDYMRELRQLYDKYDYQAALYGHFGQGCVHTRIPFDLQTAKGLKQYRSFIGEATDLCIKYGGSYTAEHGDARARSEFLPKLYGEELMEAHRQFKGIWDPDDKMNPGVFVNPQRIDENLRLGTQYDPPELETYFQYPEDDHSFSRAALRCVGVGKCRRKEVQSGEDVMCPSFLATQEEKHTTRGRARLLFEMLNGDETPGPWNNHDVHEALDLCLACKGCKNDCPVHVDMATYKAEFYSHYYKENTRPRSAYTMGLIYWWARLASTMPKIANFFAKAPGLSSLLKKAAGVSEHRQMPTFTEQTLKDWFFKRHVPKVDGQKKPTVMLWPDTFTNFMKPEAGKAAVRVLETAGYQVVMPQQSLCCGRPLYDYGLLDLAQAHWQKILATLEPQIEQGIPLVGIEPSCVASFRDELTNMYPNDQDARRLHQQTYTLAEFLHNEADNYQPPTLKGKALMHGHCHHKSIMGTESEVALLEQMGLDYEVLRSSCCGMAGSFGFEEEHYDISMEIGEHSFFPAVRKASKNTLIIADGFSCREQIIQGTDREALHIAEVLDMAQSGGHQVGEVYPERLYIRQHAHH